MIRRLFILFLALTLGLALAQAPQSLTFNLVATTAPASAAAEAASLNGSAGETLISVRGVPPGAVTRVEWTVSNIGRFDVHVVGFAYGDLVNAVSLKVAAGETMTFALQALGGVSGIVLDGVAGSDANITAKSGGVDARDAGGSTTNRVTWF